MAERRIAFGPVFRRAIDRVGARPGSAKGRAVAVTMREIAASAELPAAQDVRTIIPPTLHVLARVVPGHGIWLLFEADSERVRFVTITRERPAE